MNSKIVLPKFVRKSSPVFKHFLPLDQVTYQKVLSNKIIAFSTLEKKQQGEMLMISMIRQDEAELWKSCQELLGNIFNSIEPKLRGFFRFELLSVEMAEDWDDFQWGEFSKGMVELAHELSIGESQFAQYCSVFGIFTKHAYEDFGKISFNPHVKIFDKDSDQLDTTLSSLIRESQREQGFQGRNQLIFYDLSRQPLYDRQNLSQQLRIDKMGQKLDSNLGTSVTEVYIIDKNGLHQLFQKSQMELF